MKEWYAKYKTQGFVVVGVHFPEFNYERDLTNVTKAVKEYGIEYPVVLDNEGKIWQAYRQQYWPTRHLVDKQGRIRYTHIGEGAYEETDRYIQQLLSER